MSRPRRPRRIAWRPHVHDESGFSLIIVIVLASILSVMAAVTFTSLRQTQQGSRSQRNVSSARGVADGGAEKLIYELGLTGTQWDDYPGSGPITGTIGDGTYTALITATGSNERLLTVTGEYPTGSGDTIDIQVLVRREAPAAFDYAMFADRNITIHHHTGSSFIAPRIFTTGVHGNADVSIDASAEFRVSDVFEAVGDLKMSASNGNLRGHTNLSYSGGPMPAGGYTWRYDIGNGDLCYPGAIPHGEPGHKDEVHTPTDNGCNGTEKFVGGTRIEGRVEVGGIELTTTGTIDGDLYVDDDGTFAIDGTVTGTTTLTPEPPAAIEFPSIDYENTYKVRAVEQESLATCPTTDTSLMTCGVPHVFDDEGDFFDFVTDPANNLYRNADHTVWTGSGTPAYILARGDWYFESGFELDVDEIRDRTDDQGVVPATDPVLPLVVAGSIVAPEGSISIQGRLFLVGRGNRTDFLDSSQPEGVDFTKFLSNTPVTGFSIVEPGVLAAGGGQKGSDYDSDGPWETSAQLEATEINETWIRGLVYSGEYDAASQKSTATDQHWHNYDPKNKARIYGAQVGGKLHDCNNFSFTYDAVVKNAFGFSGSGGGVQVVSWDEL